MFIAEMARALAWPVAAVTLGLIFRRTIRSLLEGVRLRQIKKGEWSADFETAAREVRAELPSSVRNEPVLGQSSRLDEQSLRIADIASAAAIADHWNKLGGRIKSDCSVGRHITAASSRGSSGSRGERADSSANCRRDPRIAEHA